MTKKIYSLSILILLCAVSYGLPRNVRISKAELMDKIKGGWAGQTIGCTYGGPTEFRYRQCMIPDSISINWDSEIVSRTMTHNKHLYDDVYMDLTFVNVFDRCGLDAPADSFATAFANAEYMLWHANQQARYNIQHGIMPPMSGHWTNNPHADDIDFQIEADYAGLMAPCMTSAACHYADEIGHMMNYGDGWYGGVYVAAMYSLAFICDDVKTVVSEALKVIPAESRFYRAMSDVIHWHEENPDDWKATWQLIEENHGFDVGCPEGVHRPYNIDAVINSAYILVGLLYGDGDFEKTMDISTRCGQDSDCNPASAAGILATMMGYSNIPEKFLGPLKDAEDIDFAYTTFSLNKTYELSYNQALQVIAGNRGKIRKNKVKIKVDKPVPVRLEQSFEGIVPGEKQPLTIKDNSVSFEFDGCGVVVCGSLKMSSWRDFADYVAEVEVVCDGKSSTVDIPAHGHDRLEQIWFDYGLEDGHHSVTVTCKNPREGVTFNPSSYIYYVKN